MKPLVVSFPVTLLPANDLSILVKRFNENSNFCTTFVQGDGRVLSFSVHKVCDATDFVLTIEPDFTWSLAVSSFIITQYISKFTSRLDSVSMILEVLSHLDGLMFCNGNCKTLANISNSP